MKSNQVRRRLETRIGERYAMLVILDVKRGADYQGYALARCDCGTEKWMDAQGIFAGKSVSCGCWASCLTTERNLSHGMAGTRIYRIWAGMISRATNRNIPDAKHYSLRGISVCKKWLSFDAFYEDMKAGYADDLTIERKNNDGPYSKRNCRWATSLEQRLNRTDNRILEVDGEKLPMCVWSKRSGISRKVIDKRLQIGWNTKKAIFHPVRKFKWRRRRSSR